MSTKRKAREGWKEAAEAADLAIEAGASAHKHYTMAAAYQIAMGRIAILADYVSGTGTDSDDAANVIDAFAGAIEALAKTAMRENEV